MMVVVPVLVCGRTGLHNENVSRHCAFELCLKQIRTLPLATLPARRIISASLILTLLLSLVAQANGGRTSCGAADRAQQKEATASKGHDCHGCQARKASVIPDEKPRSKSPATLRFATNRYSFCCSEGRDAMRVHVEHAVPITRVVFDLSARATAVLFSDCTVSPSSVARRAPLIDGSPPHLAAAVQHTYLRTSSFLI